MRRHLLPQPADDPRQVLLEDIALALRIKLLESVLQQLAHLAAERLAAALHRLLLAATAAAALARRGQVRRGRGGRGGGGAAGGGSSGGAACGR